MLNLTLPELRSLRSERFRTLLFSGFVLGLTSVPYLIGYAGEGGYWRFTGFVFGVEDGNSYIAKMLSGSFGAWLFRSPYTADTQSGVFLLPLYILLGKLAAPPGLHVQLTVLFHLFRLAAGFLMILATADFLAVFVVDPRLRRLGLAMIILGGGLGWLPVLMGRSGWFGSMGLDFFSPEAFGFLSLYGLPHLALARALMLWALIEWMRGVQEVENGAFLPPAGRSIRFSGLWLACGLAQPLTMLVLGAIFVWHLSILAGILWVSRGQKLKVDWSGLRRLAAWLMFAGLVPGAFALYNVSVSIFNPYMRMWSAQNLILSPNLFHFALAYLLVAPFAWMGVSSLVHRSGPASSVSVLLPAWIILALILAFLPIGIQRRLIEGVWVAWVVLAMIGLEGSAFRGPTEKSVQYRWAVGLFGLSLPTTVLLLVGGYMTASTLRTPAFRPVEEVRMFEYLQSEALPGEVVMAAYETSNPLPAWAPVRVLVGHGPESVRLTDRMLQVKAFYSSQTLDQERLALIRELNINWIVIGPAERRLGDWNPETAAYLRRVYVSGEYRLYHAQGE